MRYTDLKLTEATVGKANLSSQPGYIDAINQLIADGQPLQMGDNGQFTFQPNPGQKINSMEGGIAGKGQNHLGRDVDQIQAKFVFKSPAIKKLGKGGTTDDDSIAFNAGEVAEGIHAVAAFVRLTTRPSHQITVADLYPIVNRLENGKTLVLKAKEVESDIADEFHVTVSLKPEQWEAFKQLDKIINYKKIAGIARNIVDDANKESGRFADLYEKNGKFDLVRVIGDGVSGETETKTDINFENETSRKYKGYSIKAGSTGQIHQVGGGRTTISAEERFDIINKELLGVHGRGQIVDIESAKPEFVELWNSGRVFTAYRRAYEAAVDAMNQELQTDQGENDFIKRMVNALKYWMRRDEEGVVLKQFTGTGKGTYILDADKLDELQDAGLNLVAKMASTQEPTLRVIDTKSKKALFEIRAKGEEKKNGYYFRNIINKGPLFVTLTDVSSKD